VADQTPRRLQREGLLFFGAMGAGLSHELSNVFNIINELSGLQQDILAAAADGGTAGLARVADLSARIKSLVGRGEEINRSLHKLSHSVDDADLSFDLGTTLALFGSLAARAARLAEVELTVRPPENPLAHRGDPFALLLALHGCVGFALRAAASERRVEVWTESVDGGIRVVVGSADPLPDPANDPVAAAALSAGGAALAASVHIDRSAATPHRISVTLDGRAPGGDDREQPEV
jgi:C4-dicarboxylate-specific signal transduction histidine kinase